MAPTLFLNASKRHFCMPNTHSCRKKMGFSSFFGWGYVAHYIMQVPPGLNLQFFSAWGPKSGWSGTVKGCQTLLGWPGIFLWWKWQGNGRKKGHFREKNEKMAVMRLSIECQKIPSYGSMATLRPFHFWEKLGFKSWGKRVIKVYARQGGVVRSI